MDPLTITPVTFTLKQGTTAVTGTVSYAGVTATFNPLSTLAPITTYTATMTTEARDLAGNRSEERRGGKDSSARTTATHCNKGSCTVTANTDTTASVIRQIAVAISMAIHPLTITPVTFTLKQGTTAVTGTVSYAGVTATFNPLSTLAPITTYTATMTTEARDLAGN